MITRGQPLPYQNALQRVYMFSMALGRVLIQVNKHADPNRASQEPVSAICTMARNLGWKMVVDSEQGRRLGAAAGGGGGGW